MFSFLNEATAPMTLFMVAKTLTGTGTLYMGYQKKGIGHFLVQASTSPHLCI